LLTTPNFKEADKRQEEPTSTTKATQVSSNHQQQSPLDEEVGGTRHEHSAHSAKRDLTPMFEMSDFHDDNEFSVTNSGLSEEKKTKKPTHELLWTYNKERHQHEVYS